MTKTIISDEIIASHKENLDRLKAGTGPGFCGSAQPGGAVSRSRIYVLQIPTAHTWAGEFLQPEKLVQLSRFIQDGSASNITEAIKVYRDAGQDER